MKTEWIDVKERLPPAKEGWNHSERVLLFYPGNETQTTEYGIGYYHYDPPYKKASFTDFSNYNRQPSKWSPIEPPVA